MYDSNALVYTTMNRPFSTLGQISEKLKARRHKDYAPNSKDCPEYDKEKFDK